MLILIDIDGTISDERWRNDLAQARQWDDYHMRLVDDPPIKPILSLLTTLGGGGAYIIGITGRPERYRQATLDWMLKYNVSLDELWMRPDDDYSKAAELKPKLAALIATEYDKVTDVVFIDDNEDICAAMRDAGFLTLTIKQCG